MNEKKVSESMPKFVARMIREFRRIAEVPSSEETHKESTSRQEVFFYALLALSDTPKATVSAQRLLGILIRVQFIHDPKQHSRFEFDSSLMDSYFLPCCRADTFQGTILKTNWEE